MKRTCVDCGFPWVPDLEKDSDDCPMCKWKALQELTVQNNMKLQTKVHKMRRKCEVAMDILQNYGSIDGVHHKMWAIDQALRALMGDEKYKNFRKEMEEHGYVWDEGIAP